ncbi:hypothetical protein PsYK624_062650 [Phanerochaete sordida]|uniref:Uncharacterized protein n=1 Tax=Phanerochaete sordida TaxID=48140 RepID=A0A9P3G8A7_9APHY|nr:hypothetical protein PsYK624_062650 [Phanerochaete sordida]
MPGLCTGIASLRWDVATAGAGNTIGRARPRRSTSQSGSAVSIHTTRLDKLAAGRLIPCAHRRDDPATRLRDNPGSAVDSAVDDITRIIFIGITG